MSRLTDILLRLTLPLLLLGSGSASLFAQTAAVKGHVADQQAAVIPGASVEIVNADKTVDKTVQSDDGGSYIVEGLPAGKYHLSVQMAGFETFTSDELTLAAGQTLVIDVPLKVAEAAPTEIKVQANNAAAAVELETATISTTLSTKEISSLGLNGRNVSQLIALAPGVSNVSGQDEGKVGVAGAAKFTVNGGRIEYNSFEVDGSDVLNTSINASRGQGLPLMVYPSVDAVQDIKVLTSSYDAMYGKSASGIVLISTKQGAKQFHGNVYEFLRNEAFNARNYFDQPIQEPNGQLVKKTALYRRQDFGFTLGGPIFIPGVYNPDKDKTFFFLSEEFRFEKTPTNYNQAVPTVAERQGNFSDVCPAFVPGGSPYFSPSQYPDCPYNRLTGTPFTPGRSVVAGNISQAFLNTGIIPEPNSTFGCNTTNPTTLPRCYNTTVSPETNWHEDLFRIDHAITPNEQLSFRYIHDAWSTTTLTPQWGIVQNSFPTVENKLVGPGIDMIFILTQNLPHSFFNHIDVGFSEQHITLTPEPGPGVTSLDRPAALDQPCSMVTSGQSANCPMGYIFANSPSSKLPGLIFQGTNGAYGGHGFAVDTGYAPWEQRNPTYYLRDDAIKVWGKHQIQFGGFAAYVQQNELSADNGANSGDTQGILTFSNQQSLNTSGNAFADFLMGPGTGGLNQTAIKSFTQDSSQAKYYNRYKIAEFYIQDTWHIIPRLTITGGLRASLFGAWYNPKNTAYNWRPEAYDQSLGASVMVDPSLGFLAYQTSAGSGVPGTPVTLPNRTGPYTLQNLNPAISNGLMQCGVSGISQSCMSNHLFNPGPRIGFSWDPWGNGKTAIRGGYGLYWEHGTGYEANVGSLIGSPPVVLSETQSNIPSPAGNDYGSYNLIGYSCQDPNQNAQCGSYAKYASAPVTFPLNVTSIPTKAVYSYAQQWSLSIQQQLTNNVVAQIAYVGTKGTHLTAVQDLNQLNPLASSQNPFGPGQPITASVCNSGALYNYFSVTGSNPTGQTGISSSPGIGPTSPGYTNMVVACTGNPGFVGSTGKAIGLSPDAARPYIGFSNIISVANIANSSYNALQATFRATAGKLILGASYTYAHSIDDSSDRSSANFANSLDLRSNRANSDFDQRQLLNVEYVYELPLERLLNGFRDLAGPPAEEDAPSPTAANPDAPHYPVQIGSFWHAALAGWQISGITLYQSGVPFSVVNGGGSDGTAALDNAGVGDGLGIGSYADIVGSPHGVKPTVSNSGGNIGPLLLNPSAYAAPRGLTFGDSGRNSLNNPSRVNFNLSLIKYFTLAHERLNMEFRIESFNLFNHTQFRIYDPSHPGNSGNNVVNCYGDISTSYSAGAQSCLAGNSFLHPVDAHDPRILQFGLKAAF